jgi:hypothetical protein
MAVIADGGRGGIFRGTFWDEQTHYAVLDIDAGSQYHNAEKLASLLAAVESVGLAGTLYQSSESGGWHLYISFLEEEISSEIEGTLKRWLKALGYEIRGGQLEIFPSGNALRLPLQPGFAWLKRDGRLNQRREDLTLEQALINFLRDQEQNATDWQSAKSRMESQMSAADRVAGIEDQARQKRLEIGGLDDLFEVRKIQEYWDKGRKLWQEGLSGAGQRHDAVLFVGHYLWYGDPENHIAALPGSRNDEYRAKLIEHWLTEKHNGFCRHIDQNKWEEITAQIKRAVLWRGNKQAREYEPYRVTDRLLKRLLALYRKTGKLWTVEEFEKANHDRRLEARARIAEAVINLEDQKRLITLAEVAREAHADRRTVKKNVDLLTRCVGEYNRGGAGGLAVLRSENSVLENESTSQTGCVLDSLRSDRTGQTAKNSRQETTEVLAAVHLIQSNSGVKHERQGSAPYVASGGMDCGINGCLPASGSPPFNPRPIFSMGAPALNLRQLGNCADGWAYNHDDSCHRSDWISLKAHAQELDKAKSQAVPLERASGYVPLSCYDKRRQRAGGWLLSSNGYIAGRSEGNAMGNEANEKHEQQHRPTERQTDYEKRAQGEVNANVKDYTEHVTARRLEKKLSGNSGATGQLPDQNGKGLASAKDLLGDNAHGLSKKEKQTALLAQVEKDGYIVGKPQEEPMLIADSGEKQNQNLAQSETQYGLGSDGRWQFQNPRVKPGQDIAGALKEWIWNDSAKDISNLPGAFTGSLINGAWAITEPLLKGINEWMQHKPDFTYLEFVSGIEKARDRSPWKDVSFEGTDKAYSAFPDLAKHNIPKELISGIILNEVLHAGDFRDAAEDDSVRKFGTVRDSKGRENGTASVGPGQIQIQNIHQLIEKYPQLGQFKDDPVRAAVNPEITPMFVAAYLCDKVSLLDKYNTQHPNEKPIPVVAATLAYLYNPDVISSNGHFKVIETSDKVATSLLHMNTREGWHSENLPRNDEIIRRSKVIQDILMATKACYR